MENSNNKFKTAIPLNEQKQIMLDIMNQFFEYLEKHNLHYCLIGGSLLGAIRHKGFIPWDDDVDIIMPLNDIHKLIDLIEKEPLPNDLYLSSVYTNSDHIWPMLKLISTKTFLVEPNVFEKYQKRQESYGGVYIDIFPAYGVPDDAKKQKKFCNKLCKLYEGVKRSSRIVNFADGYGSPIRALIYKICFIPYRIVGLNYYLKKITSLIEKYQFGSTKYIATSVGLVNKMRDVIPTEYVNDTIEVPFEELTAKIPKNYDYILKKQYGDYMKLPPKSERRTHPRKVFYRKNEEK